MIQSLTTPQRVIPTLATDSRGRLVAVVISEDVIGVCMKRIGREAFSASTYNTRLQKEAWATLVRQHDGVYFITLCGLIPPDEAVDPSVLSLPRNAEAAHMAIEIGLSIWPEWGEALRGHYRPKAPVFIRLPEQLRAY
jgi:hypothetical protein